MPHDYAWMEPQYRKLGWSSKKRIHVSKLSIEDIRKISKSPKVFEEYSVNPKLGNGARIIDKARRHRFNADMLRLNEIVWRGSAKFRGWDWCYVSENEDHIPTYLLLNRPKLERTIGEYVYHFRGDVDQYLLRRKACLVTNEVEDEPEELTESEQREDEALQRLIDYMEGR